MGTSCSALQATVQAWQPIHFRWSMTNAYFMIRLSPRRAGCATVHLTASEETSLSYVKCTRGTMLCPGPTNPLPLFCYYVIMSVGSHKELPVTARLRCNLVFSLVAV